MRVVDNAIALRIIYLIVRDFKAWPAYKQGVIDSNGEVIDKKKAKTSGEWTMLHRMVARIKILVGKLPGGKSIFARLATGYFLMRDFREDVDYMELDDEELIRRYHAIEENLTEEDIEFVLNEFSGVGIAAGIAPDENDDVEPVVKSINNKYTRRNRKQSAMIRRNGFTPKTFKMFINGE